MLKMYKTLIQCKLSSHSDFLCQYKIIKNRIFILNILSVIITQPKGQLEKKLIKHWRKFCGDYLLVNFNNVN
jgi:hypothetical protein